MSSFVQVVISQNELKLLDSVEKLITLNVNPLRLSDSIEFDSLRGKTCW